MTDNNEKNTVNQDTGMNMGNYQNMFEMMRNCCKGFEQHTGQSGNQKTNNDRDGKRTGNAPNWPDGFDTQSMFEMMRKCCPDFNRNAKRHTGHSNNEEHKNEHV